MGLLGIERWIVPDFFYMWSKIDDLKKPLDRLFFSNSNHSFSKCDFRSKCKYGFRITDRCFDLLTIFCAWYSVRFFRFFYNAWHGNELN